MVARGIETEDREERRKRKKKSGQSLGAARTAKAFNGRFNPIDFGRATERDEPDRVTRLARRVVKNSCKATAYLSLGGFSFFVLNFSSIIIIRRLSPWALFSLRFFCRWTADLRNGFPVIFIANGTI